MTIPNSVTSIGDGAFGNCSNLKLCVIENGEESLVCGSNIITDSDLFLYSPLETVYVGRNLYCNVQIFNKNLKSLTIGEKVKSIGVNVFRGCSGLVSVTSLNTTPPQIDYKSFDETIYEKATLYVPKGSKTLYWLHPYWENFKNIVELDDSGVNDITVDPSPKSRGVYTIDGVKLSADADNIEILPKGIYIINGEKAVIK